MINWRVHWVCAWLQRSRMHGLQPNVIYAQIHCDAANPAFFSFFYYLVRWWTAFVFFFIWLFLCFFFFSLSIYLIDSAFFFFPRYSIFFSWSFRSCCCCPLQLVLAAQIAVLSKKRMKRFKDDFVCHFLSWLNKRQPTRCFQPHLFPFFFLLYMCALNEKRSSFFLSFSALLPVIAQLKRFAVSSQFHIEDAA